jgi:hypothetical protein
VTNVVQFPKKGSSVDEAMAWLNEQYANGRLKELLLLAVDVEGHYEVAMTKTTGMHALYGATFLREEVMKVLRAERLMPSDS